MNERIQELIEQATLTINVGGVYQYFDKEKFAQLIVLECAQVCNNIDREYEGEDVLATWCASTIREHFGVDDD